VNKIYFVNLCLLFLQRWVQVGSNNNKRWAN
jgi:hypothetical protein